MDKERKDSAQILADARRGGKVPVSTAALAAFTFALVLGSTWFIASRLTAFSKRVFEEGELSLLTSLTTLKPYTITVPALFISGVLLLGFIQSRFFFTTEKIIPQVPHFGFHGSWSAFIRVASITVVAALLAAVAAFAVVRLYAPQFLQLLTLPSLHEQVLSLQQLLVRVLGNALLCTVATVFLAMLIHRVLFIFNHRNGKAEL